MDKRIYAIYHRFQVDIGAKVLRRRRLFASMMKRQCWQRVSRSAGDRVRRLRLARIMEEREDPVVFGLIGMPKARIGKKSKLLHSVFHTAVCVRSIATTRALATGIRHDLGIRIGMR